MTVAIVILALGEIYLFVELIWLRKTLAKMLREIAKELLGESEE